MKIVIITPFDSANFGAFLQAYCLQRFLEEKGNTVYHIYTRSANYVDNLYKKKLPKKIDNSIGRFLFQKSIAYGKQKKEWFQKAWECFNVRDDISNDTDYCILGSDEIWNIKKAVFRNTVFWGDKNLPTIAYAVSAGEAKQSDFDQWPIYKNYMRSLHQILVRDDNTKEIVKHSIGESVSIVCDPTFLIPSETYGEIYYDSYLKENRCLLLYAYKLTTKEKTTISGFARRHGLKTVAVCFYHSWCDHQINCSPLAFSSIIKQCEMVITTTFHGSIFSILNHSKYVAISNNIKTVHLHSSLGLNDRIIDPKDISIASLEKIIDTAVKWHIIDQKIMTLRRDSSALLLKALHMPVHKFRYVICNQDKCTACYACQAVCSYNAIITQTDRYGRSIPVIDANKCIHCGACRRACPQNKEQIIGNIPLHCFAAQVTNEENRNGSSSGAIAAQLSQIMLKKNAVIYGSINTGIKTYHIGTTDSLEAELFRGSKYVQSDMDGVIKQIKKKLNDEQTVVFFGTPCQIAGIKSSVGKDNSNLFCIDLICHGVPPAVYLEQHLKQISKSKEIDRFSFRGGADDYHLKVVSKGKTIYCANKNQDPYFYAFMKALNLRKNCYQCRYAQTRRVGDITIGDFWGLNRKTLKTNQIGRISLVLVNNNKGELLWELIKNMLTWEERDLEEAIKGNSQLRRPSLIPAERWRFLKSYEKFQDFDKAFMTCGIGKKWRLDRVKQTKSYKYIRKLSKKVKNKKH